MPTLKLGRVRNGLPLCICAGLGLSAPGLAPARAQSAAGSGAVTIERPVGVEASVLAALFLTGQPPAQGATRNPDQNGDKRSRSDRAYGVRGGFPIVLADQMVSVNVVPVTSAARAPARPGGESSLMVLAQFN